MSVCFLSLEISKVFNEKILEDLELKGFDDLTLSLVVVFPYIAEEKDITISRLAKKLSYSRQAMHKSIKKLQDLDYIVLKEINKKEKAVIFTKRGEALMNVAQDYILKIEKELSEMIGNKELEEYKKNQEKIFGFLSSM